MRKLILFLLFTGYSFYSPADTYTCPLAEDVFFDEESSRWSAELVEDMPEHWGKLISTQEKDQAKALELDTDDALQFVMATIRGFITPIGVAEMPGCKYQFLNDGSTVQLNPLNFFQGVDNPNWNLPNVALMKSSLEGLVYYASPLYDEFDTAVSSLSAMGGEVEAVSQHLKSSSVTASGGENAKWRSRDETVECSMHVLCRFSICLVKGLAKGSDVNYCPFESP
ncbi:hypothetical protein EOPP23_13335 [Endozoicomonas sp. OPT23]|uniref:hypothetical protein n=1 Tax=Endozoicomonas sp. OPT23 TaxID=2072845 RepID=UPI00129BE23D|nr:hypothetical protein [Endozoicomonas sp. OPT23]MRI33973.1 hypothetical protein [Endozoicomonas sp. OPT23]